MKEINLWCSLAVDDSGKIVEFVFIGGIVVFVLIGIIRLINGLFHCFRSALIKTEQSLYYESTYNLHECIIQITKEPQQYDCKWGTALWYKAERLSDTQVLITFTGGQFRKMMRTQYLMDFQPQENYTLIILRFQNELLDLPPMTPPSDIDLCMKQRLNATRKWL